MIHVHDYDSEYPGMYAFSQMSDERVATLITEKDTATQFTLNLFCDQCYLKEVVNAGNHQELDSLILNLVNRMWSLIRQVEILNAAMWRSGVSPFERVEKC